MNFWTLIAATLDRMPRLQRMVICVMRAARERQRHRTVPEGRRHLWSRGEQPQVCLVCSTPRNRYTECEECQSGVFFKRLAVRVL